MIVFNLSESTTYDVNLERLKSAARTVEKLISSAIHEPVSEAGADPRCKPENSGGHNA